MVPAPTLAQFHFRGAREGRTVTPVPGAPIRGAPPPSHRRMKLSKITAGLSLAGLEPDRVGAVLGANRVGDAALQVVYRLPEGLADAVRTSLAWDSIVDDVDAGRLNIDQGRKKHAEKEVKAAAEVLPRAARECFKWLLCPVGTAPRSRPAGTRFPRSPAPTTEASTLAPPSPRASSTRSLRK